MKEKKEKRKKGKGNTDANTPGGKPAVWCLK